MYHKNYRSRWHYSNSLYTGPFDKNIFLSHKWYDTHSCHYDFPNFIRHPGPAGPLENSGPGGITPTPPLEGPYPGEGEGCFAPLPLSCVIFPSQLKNLASAWIGAPAPSINFISSARVAPHQQHSGSAPALSTVLSVYYLFERYYYTL